MKMIIVKQSGRFQASVHNLCDGDAGHRVSRLRENGLVAIAITQGDAHAASPTAACLDCRKEALAYLERNHGELE